MLIKTSHQRECQVQSAQVIDQDATEDSIMMQLLEKQSSQHREEQVSLRPHSTPLRPGAATCFLSLFLKPGNKELQDG